MSSVRTRITDFLCLLAAGLFVYVAIMVAAVASMALLPSGGWVVPAFVALLAAVGSIITALWLFSPRFHMMNRRSHAEIVRRLENSDLLESEAFLAQRAFQVEEFEDEGLHYYIELEDHSVLYLSGQYLYEYEPIPDDPEQFQGRRFPCTEFVIRRHREKRFVVDIVCRGSVIEPDFFAPGYTMADYELGVMPDDGEIIRDLSYEEIARGQGRVSR